jgi:hypothetical protein
LGLGLGGGGGLRALQKLGLSARDAATPTPQNRDKFADFLPLAVHHVHELDHACVVCGGGGVIVSRPAPWVQNDVTGPFMEGGAFHADGSVEGAGRG